MKLALSLFASLLLAVATVSAQTAPGFVHADGTILRDGDNHALRLRGVNLGGWLLWESWIWGGGFQGETTLLNRLASLVGQSAADAFRADVYRRYITERDIAEIARLGLNVVRVPFNARLLENANTPGTYREEGWRVLDDLLGWCEKYHVYAVLDLHAAPGGQGWPFTSDPADSAADRLWKSPLKQDSTVALWKAVAARYQDRTVVAGYDLLNEPLPPDGKALADLYRRIIAAVRAVDDHHAVFLEGSDYAKDFSMFDAPLTTNEVYSFHIYTWFGDDRKKRLAGWHALAERHKVPLWNGEFGETDLPMLQSTTALFDDPQYRVSGYGFWTWKKVSNGMFGLCTFQPPEEWRELVRWLSYPRISRQPTHDEAVAGMGAFLAACDIARCTIDPRAASFLSPHGP